jgi:hypothetical protein
VDHQVGPAGRDLVGGPRVAELDLAMPEGDKLVLAPVITIRTICLSS